MRIEIQQLGRASYAPTYAAMQAYTAARTDTTPDVIWICEHPAVYTQGLAGKTEHILNPGAIPVVATNRGGQVTYHGPGQVIAYPLIDLKRAGYFIKEYVYRIEEAIIRTLAHFGVTGHRVDGAPGIYVRLDDPGSHALLPQRPRRKLSVAGTTTSLGDGRNVVEATARLSPSFLGLGKIAALGIKVSRNCTYHGVALNVSMDLEPYSRIHPCGYAGLRTTDLSTIGVHASSQETADLLGQNLVTYLAPRS